MKAHKRAALPDVLASLRALLGSAGAPEVEATASTGAASAAGSASKQSSSPMPPDVPSAPTALSLQVRGLRQSSTGVEASSVKRNVAEAFDTFFVPNAPLKPAI